MFRYIIKHNNVVKFESDYCYNSKQDAFNAGYSHLDMWEAINNVVGVIEIEK